MISVVKTGPLSCGFSDWSGIQMLFVEPSIVVC